MKEDTCVMVLSGGQDSTTCLYWARRSYKNVYALTFDYGQRHDREIRAARRIARFAGVMHHEVVELPEGVLRGTSPLVNNDSELEQYGDFNSLPGGLEKTFVPMRNQLFLTIAANRAYNLDTNVVVTGVSAEDYGGYPDCRDTFIEALVRASSLGTFTGVDGAPDSLRILTPLMHKTKKETVEMALQYPGCYSALALSHTSYDGRYPPIGNDHATLLREKGFADARVPDPVVLRAYDEGLLEWLPDYPGYNPLETQYQNAVDRAIDWLRVTEGTDYEP